MSLLPPKITPHLSPTKLAASKSRKSKSNSKVFRKSSGNNVDSSKKPPEKSSIQPGQQNLIDFNTGVPSSKVNSKEQVPTSGSVANIGPDTELIWPLENEEGQEFEEVASEDNLQVPSCLPRIKLIMGDHRPSTFFGDGMTNPTTILSYNAQKVPGSHRHTSHGRLTIIRSDMIPPDPSQAPFIQDEHPEWELCSKIRANEAFNISKYKSKDTGLHVAHAMIECPSIHTYFIIRTKPESDDGLPHILEHLIYQGSKNYPYNSVLDLLASKCLANGSVAWTYADHTCFGLSTVGTEGFLSLLPLYLDHIFFPVLSEASFVTEVHHVNNEGHDEGVVYAERLQKEHTPHDTAHFELLRALYDEESGYRFNYGGSIKNLRELANVKPARAFHEKYYHPENVCILICGAIDRNTIFDTMKPFIEKLADTLPSPTDWISPWLQEKPIQLVHEITAKTYFPCETQEYGLVKVAIVGSCVTDSAHEYKKVGMRLLMEYLCQCPASPVEYKFIDSVDNLASSVTHSEMDHFQTVYCLEFESVLVTEMDLIEPKLRSLLYREMEAFDMERMKDIIRKMYHTELMRMENDRHEKICQAVIHDFIYGANYSDATSFDRRVNTAYTILHFEEHPKTFWQKMIERHLLEKHWVVIQCIPSISLQDRIVHEEKHRIEHWDEATKKKFRARLRAAIKANEANKAPQSLFEKMRSPAIESITLKGIERYEDPSWARDVLCKLYVDDVNSNYAYLTVLMDTSELDFEHKKYLTLFGHAIFDTHFEDDLGRPFTHEDLLNGLFHDVLEYQVHFGANWDEHTPFACGSFSHIFSIRLKMELSHVPQALEWLRLALWKTKWTSDRLRVVALRLAHSIEQLKESGEIMTKAILKDALYKKDSNVRTNALVRQQKFLKSLAASLPLTLKRISKMLNAIRHVVLRPENITVHLAAPLTKLEFHMSQTNKVEQRSMIAKTLKRTFDYTGWDWGYETRRLAKDDDQKWMLKRDCLKKCPKELILRLPSVEDESACLIQAAPCISSCKDEQYPLILTAMQYFCQPDGPFYKAIHGGGFGSGVEMKLVPNEGLIYFMLGPCTDLVGAYSAVFDIIAGHLGEIEPKIEWDENLLDGAKRSLIFELVELENKPIHLINLSIFNRYRDVPDNFNRTLMSQISRVSISDVELMAKRYFTELFLDNVPCAAAAPAADVHSVLVGLTSKTGKRLSLMPAVQQSFMVDFG